MFRSLHIEVVLILVLLIMRDDSGRTLLINRVNTFFSTIFDRRWRMFHSALFVDLIAPSQGDGASAAFATWCTLFRPSRIDTNRECYILDGSRGAFLSGTKSCLGRA